MALNPSDLMIESLTRDEAAGRPVNNKGGQHVGVIPRGVRVTHKPTGLVAFCDTERSQSKNRDLAQSMIEWGVLQVGL